MTYNQIVDALVRSGAKAVLSQYFHEGSCINSTRVLLEVFRTLRLDAMPFAVRTRIFSKAFMDRVVREGSFPTTQEQTRAWTDQPGVWSVGIGYFHAGMPSNAWIGHLVLRAGEHLLDATISQASRPSKGIELPDILLVDNVPEDFWQGHRNITTEGVDGCVVQYEPQPRNHGYMTSPAWSFRGGIEEAAYNKIMGLLNHGNGPSGRSIDELHQCQL